MKLLLAILALTSFGIFVPSMHADDLNLNLGALGQANVDLGSVVNANAGVVTYDDLNVNLLGVNGIIAGVVNLNFTAAYVDAGTALPVGATDALVVTESCIATTVTLSGPVDPCSGVSFTYVNANVGNILGVTGALNIGADVNADVLGLNAGLDIGTNSETIGFGNPPAATPEPGTLSLMGTGLLGLAGALRRKFRKV
jgi:hypothetical protein